MSGRTITETVQDTAKQELNELVEDNVDSTDTELRYVAYGARLRTAIRAGTRYVAYTSDIGEAFRPVVPPWIVTAGYAVSWCYLLGDVGYETYKAKRRGPTPLDVATGFSETTRLAFAATERATFQSIASMGLPALTIHTIVKQSKKAFVNVKNVKLKTWGPTVTGLAVVPLLPYLFDHPVESATERTFGWLKQRLSNNDQPRASNNEL